MESKYQKGQIYKIVDVGYNLCYIGSTCEKLSQRLVRHRIDYRNKKKKLSVRKIFDEYGIENCKIEWIEDYPCNSKKELLAREGHYIKSTECVNRNVEGRTDQEKKDVDLERRKQWCKTNQEHLRQYTKEYNEKNLEKLKQQKKEWRENNKDKKRKWIRNGEKTTKKDYLNILKSMLKKTRKERKHTGNKNIPVNAEQFYV